MKVIVNFLVVATIVNFVVAVVALAVALRGATDSAVTYSAVGGPIDPTAASSSLRRLSERDRQSKGNNWMEPEKNGAKPYTPGKYWSDRPFSALRFSPDKEDDFGKVECLMIRVPSELPVGTDKSKVAIALQSWFKKRVLSSAQYAGFENFAELPCFTRFEALIYSRNNFDVFPVIANPDNLFEQYWRNGEFEKYWRGRQFEHYWRDGEDDFAAYELELQKKYSGIWAVTGPVEELDREGDSTVGSENETKTDDDDDDV